MKTIETVDDYYKLIESARSPLFTIIKDSEIIVNDFELLIPKEVIIPKDLHIRDAVIKSGISQMVKFMYSTVMYKEKSNDLIIVSDVEYMTKLNNVKTLLHYLNPKGQPFSNSFIESSSLKMLTEKL